MGTVVTFYSYKGGVGRSMAVANIAVLLAQQGRRILIVDWDLEAPGLERYLQSFGADPVDGDGLLPFLESAKAGQEPDFEQYTWTVRVPDSEPIKFLASGRESDPAGYVSRLHDFDWGSFFESGGGDFLERLRDRWKATFDFVLIDSRTGLSDSGGVCTIQLPDIIVAMFTPNFQSLLGTRDVMTFVREARQKLAYSRMKVTVVPLPARIATSTELRLTAEWMDRIGVAFQDFYEDWLPTTADASDVPQRLKIPQIDYFGFGESLPVVEQGVADPAGMGFAYDQLARLLMDDFESAATVLNIPRKRAAVEVTAGHDYQYDVYVSFNSTSHDGRWLDTFVAELTHWLTLELERPPRIFYSPREITLGERWPERLAEALLSSRVMVALLTPNYLRSSWAMGELQTFLLREKEYSHQHLIFLVHLHGGENYPQELSRPESFDFRRSFTPFLSKKSPMMERLSEDVRRLAIGLAERLEDVPSYSDQFPIVQPGEARPVGRYTVELPLL